MIFNREKEIAEKKFRLLNMLVANKEDDAFDRVTLMSNAEFAMLNTEANDLYEKRAEEAAKFQTDVRDMMTKHVEETGTMMAPLMLLRLAEGVRASLVISGFDGDVHTMMEAAASMEFYRCILDVLGVGVAADKSIIVPSTLS